MVGVHSSLPKQLPRSCLEPEYAQHRVVIPPDDGGPVTFRWHFPRGTLDPRMSGLELATFVLSHMPHILPFFAAHPRVQAEFQAMMVSLATQPKAVLDRLLPWIRSITREEEDDVLLLSIYDQTDQPGPTHFLVTA